MYLILIIFSDLFTLNILHYFSFRLPFCVVDLWLLLGFHLCVRLFLTFFKFFDRLQEDSFGRNILRVDCLRFSLQVALFVILNAWPYGAVVCGHQVVTQLLFKIDLLRHFIKVSDYL